MTQLVITLVILGITIVLFCTNKVPQGLCGLFCSVALLLTGVLTASEAFAGFSNSNVVIMFCMMIISAGLMKTHLMEKIVGLVQKVGGGSVTSVLVGFGLILILMSQFMNAFVAVACIIPFVTGMCDDMNIPRTKVMFPLTVISLVWVFMFPVGMGISNVAQMNGYLESFESTVRFGMWTLTWARLPVAIITTIFSIFVLPKLCPAESSVAVQQNLGREIEKSTISPKKEILAYVVSLGSILMMLTNSLHGIAPVNIAAAGAFLMVFLGVLPEKEAIKSVNWGMVFMFAGILPIATALTKTGASDVVGNAIQTVLGGTTSPWVINFAFGITVFILTQFLSNTAMVAVFMPLALLICTSLNLNPTGVMGIIYIGATSSILTPMATPGIPLTMGAAGYSFKDIVKMGLAPALLEIILGIVWCSLIFPAV
jgi:anion transporter